MLGQVFRRTRGLVGLGAVVGVGAFGAGCGGGGGGTTTPGSTLVASPPAVTFAATLSGSTPASQNVAVTSSGTSAIGSLVAAISYAAGQPTGWLAATLSTTSTPATLTLQAATGSLGVGAWTATVSLASSAGLRTVSVTANITGTAPTLRYAFEGSTENSGSASGPTGTATSTSFVAGKFGQAIKFGGSPSSVTFAGTAAVFAAGFKWTISLWYKEDVLKANALLWSFRGGSGGWETYHGATPDEMTTCSNGGCFTYATPVATGTWRNLIYRYDGASATVGAPVQMYLDGTLIGSLDNPTLIPLATAGIIDMKIGGDQGIGPSVFAVDEVRIFNAVFSLADQCTKVIGGTWNGTACTLP